MSRAVPSLISNKRWHWPSRRDMCGPFSTRARRLRPCCSRLGVPTWLPLATPFPQPPPSAGGGATISHVPGSREGQGSKGLVEPLSERELGVLRLLAEGLTYAEIAQRLVVSLNTVRFHVKEIYDKLRVNRQAQAVARAREVGVL